MCMTHAYILTCKSLVAINIKLLMNTKMEYKNSRLGFDELHVLA